MHLYSVLPIAALAALPALGQTIGQAERSNMDLVGSHDLQARSAYQPIVQKQGERWIAYVGHHGGRSKNPLTGADEDNGTSVLDVTDPAKPALLTTVVKGLKGTHKNWWECDSGIAYLVSGIDGWRTRRMTQVYDLSDPTQPRPRPSSTA